MMDAILEPGVEDVTLMLASRLGKTTCIENVIGYFVDYDPAPMLLINETDKKARSFSKISLQPMINDNPHLTDKFAKERTRDSDNEILLKSFRGGHLVLGGANAPTSFSSYNMRIVMFDEIDRYPPSVGDEGDPIDLGRQRAENFLNRKFIYTSTPTVKGVSRIEDLWLESDQRLYYVPCPSCGHMQILLFGGQSQFSRLTNGFLKFTHSGNTIKSVCYICSSCKAEIPEKYKMKMVRAGEWRKQRPEVRQHAGFWANRLYSPWTSWKRMAEEFIKAGKRPEKLRVWINTSAGETFIENINFAFADGSLMARRESYTKIPNAVILLTVGIDVQDDRVEAIVYGYGKREECWFIERGIIMGSIESKTTQKMLDEFIYRDRVYENGFIAKFGKIGGILAVGVDTGDHSKEVNAYVSERKRQRFIAIKGASRPQKDFVIYSRSKKLRNPLVFVDTFQGKKMIYYRLHIEKDEDGSFPPQYMQFNMSCDAEFFEQMVSEQLKIKKVDGHPRQVWSLPSGRRNEVLDCTDYALAGLHVLVPGGSKNIEPFLERLSVTKERMTISMQLAAPEKSKSDDNTAPAAATPTPQHVGPPKKRFRMRIRR